MCATPIKRRLVAILAADAVGYSKLMAKDEEGTMRILAAHRAMIDGIIELQEGRIVNTAGDSVIAEFDSPVQAVRCAVEIQDALRTRNDSLPEDQRLVFRIGVNLGDVMVKGDDLLGDGINVAARLESIADPGGICMSSSVYDQIAGKLDLSFVDVGNKTLKNIGRPVRVYRIDRDGRSGTKRVRGLPPAAKWLTGLGAVAGLAFGAWYFALAPLQEATKRADSAAAGREAKAAEAAKAAEQRLAAKAAEAERLRAEAAEQQRAKDNADLAKQIAAAEAARKRAEAQASAAVEAKRALEVERVAEGRARAEADLERLRAEAQEEKRKAAAELTAAIAARRAAETAAAAPVVPKPAMPPAISLREGLWVAEFLCPPHKIFPERTITTLISVANGVYLIEVGKPEQPGSLALRGALNVDGSVLFRGTGVSGRIGGARPYEAAFTARLIKQRYEGSGQLGDRDCDLVLKKR